MRKNALPLFFCVLIVCGYGCATKGGWPCWAWQKKTDQKNEKYGEQMLKQATNQPVNTTNK